VFCVELLGLNGLDRAEVCMSSSWWSSRGAVEGSGSARVDVEAADDDVDRLYEAVAEGSADPRILKML